MLNVFFQQKVPTFDFLKKKQKKNINHTIANIGMIEGDGLWSCTYEKKVDKSFLTIFHDTWTKTHVQILSWSNELFNFIQIVEDPIWMWLDDDGWTLPNMGEKNVNVSYYS